jgi:hypothetical protein
VDLSDRIAALEAELAALKAAVVATATATDTAPTDGAVASVTPLAGHPVASRRNFFRTAAAGTAGLVAGAVAFAGPAAAADNQSVLLGAPGDAQNTASTPTKVQYTGGALDNANSLTVSDSATFSSSQPAAIAGYASTRVKNGVYGYTTTSDGYGVVASNANGGGGTGLWARSIGGVAARLEGWKANALLVPGSVAGPVPGAHERGELYVDANGDLWYCTTPGTPGIWRKVSGPATAGQLHVFDKPARSYDSREDAAGKLVVDADRVVDLTKAKAGPGIPAGAVAAWINLTITNTQTSPGGGGYVAVYSNAAVTYPGTSSINWSAANENLANGTLTAVDSAGKIKVRAGVNRTDVVIDILGYFL